MSLSTDRGLRTMFAYRPGRMSAGLAFRVGYADETLPTSGITALALALALRSVERPGLDLTASVGPAVTEVRVSGSEDRVRATLRGLSDALTDLPVRHRGTEARALRERTADVVALPPWRFGLQGYGLGPGQYVGLHRVTDDELRAWARRWFVGSNAVAWSTGESTPDLDLALPDGAGHDLPAPPADGLAPHLPAEAPAGGNKVMWDAVVPDVPALGVLAEVARRAVFQNLRHDRGWTYDVYASVGVLDGQRATLQIAAGFRPETAAAATGEFLDTWGRLRYAVDENELETARAHLLMAFDEPHQDAMWLSDDAVRALLGRESVSPAQRRTAIENVTAADVVALARQAWDSGLLVTPVGSGWAGTSFVPRGAGEPVTGRAFERLDADATIVVGNEGATLRDGRTRSTVRFDATAALLAYPDGGRLLIGLDGARVPLEPNLHDDLDVPAVVRLVDQHVPSGRTIPVPRPEAPERPDKARIQRVRKARAEREAGEGGLRGRSRRLLADAGRVGAVVGIFLALLTAISGVLTSMVGLLFWALAAWLDGPQDWQYPAIMAPAGLICAGVTWLCYRGLRRLRQ
jgi:zinc protease